MTENYNRTSEAERNSEDYWNYLLNVAEKELLFNEDIDNETMRTVVNREDISCL